MLILADVYILLLRAGRHRPKVHKELCALVSDTPVGCVLLSINDEKQCEELYRCYLHDFVHSVHKCTHKMKENIKVEYKVY